jgi:hypothetical protein
MLKELIVCIFDVQVLMIFWARTMWSLVRCCGHYIGMYAGEKLIILGKCLLIEAEQLFSFISFFHSWSIPGSTVSINIPIPWYVSLQWLIPFFCIITISLTYHTFRLKIEAVVHRNVNRHLQTWTRYLNITFQHPVALIHHSSTHARL